MCHASSSVCYLSEGREKKRKQAHHHGHLMLGIFICRPTFHLSSLQVEGVRKINEENHVHTQQRAQTQPSALRLEQPRLPTGGVFAFASPIVPHLNRSPKFGHPSVP